VEFANVIIINKADLITDADLCQLKSLLASLNPAARILSTTFGAVPLNSILNTGLFDFTRASQAPGWLQELRGTHTPETVEFGISSFVFEVRSWYRRYVCVVEVYWPETRLIYRFTLLN